MTLADELKRGPKLTASSDPITAARSLKAEGYGVVDISRRMNVAETTVWRWLRTKRA